MAPLPLECIQTKNLPWKSHFIDVEESFIQYLDEGKGNPVLFLHGNPTSGYLWRNVFSYLTSNARCIVPDLIGMGKSGKPDISYRFEEHYRYLQAFINALELKNITLVLHDWGSALGFYYAKNHSEKIKKIAFMEAIVRPWQWTNLKWDHRLGFKLLRAPLIGKFLIYRVNVFLNIFLPKLILRKLSREEKQAYKAPFKKPSTRKPMLIWPNEIPIHRKPRDISKIVESYSKWLGESAIPKLLIYVHPGAIINKETVNYCQKHIKNLQIKYIGEGLHFIQEDHPQAIGKALREWYIEKDEKEINPT